MDNVRTRPIAAIEEERWQNWLAQALVFTCLIVTMGVYITVPFLANRWMQLPFLGVFVDPALVITNASPAGDAAAWGAYQQGLRWNRDPSGQVLTYRLHQVAGQNVERWADLRAVLAAAHPGDTLPVLAFSSTGARLEVHVLLGNLSPADQWSYFTLPYVVGLVYLVVGIWVFLLRRNQVAGRVFALFAVGATLSLGLVFDGITSHLFSGLWAASLALAGAAAVALALLYPRPDPLLRRFPALVYVGGVAGLLLAAYAIWTIGQPQDPFAFTAARRMLYAFSAFGLLFFLGWWIYRLRRADFSNEQDTMRWVFLAALCSFLPLSVWLASMALGVDWSFPSYWLLLFLIFPITEGVRIQRYRAIEVDAVLRRGLYYGVFSVFVSVGYALISAGASLLLGRWISPDSPVIAGFLFFLLAILFAPLRESTQRLVDRVFFRGRRAYQERLQLFSGELTRMVTLEEILRVLRRYIEESLAPSRLHLFVYDVLSDVYLATPDSRGRPTSDLRFPMLSGLVIRMSEQRAPLMLNGQDPLPGILEADRAKLALLNASVFVPMPGRQRLLGWLALGDRMSGDPYSSMQLRFLEALCDQAALAIERAQVVESMQNRVREMNVLTLVARGMNVTVGLDEILELVSTQTLAILPAQHLRIMLYEKELDIYQYAFYLQGDDRLSEQENRPVMTGSALEQEVIRQRKAILTDDYRRECQHRGILAGQASIAAWLCVPLDSGSETIGALSLGSSDPAVEYTPEQQHLLESIADQVAGALVKARLLQETERRARQLTTLHDVTRQLTSTLEPEPLLRSILDSAVEILNCEAGSLLMVDQQTDELVFKVVVGPVATDLVEHRMPYDQGVVGQAVFSRRSVIVNDVNTFNGWFAQADMQTGFMTRALLAIPLMVKERVIGVIEVINKKDGTFFSHDDEDLLSAFAAQAAVALENARLYTLTDQALAERVEELSVMQRIDRELNTSLDITQAMQTTLEWAMRRSGATAGLVAALQGGDPVVVQVMASEGYNGELDAYQADLLPAIDDALREMIWTGVSHRRSTRTGAFHALLKDCRSQAMVPIRRETNTIGLLLLESIHDDQISNEGLSFLSRLTDHASIAIANAQLYAAVQQANLAKSDFVSFVAHELKNPMTSVKGYTELISTGAVGPITDVQSNFLTTIRHNIDRMNTLVSDLNDMSKIEVGRLRLDFKAVALKDVIESVVRSTRRQIEEKQLALQQNIPDDLPLIWADSTRLEQVMVNLVSNAYKYTDPGGVIELFAEVAENQWDPNGASRVVHIWVKDNGIGIHEDDQKKIFQKFFRSDDPKTREVNGTGLGLNITRSLVEMQGGEIWFESEYRHGTTFHFTIPVSEMG